MSFYLFFTLCLFSLKSFVLAANYEVIFESIENELGKEDNVFDFGSMRVKKFNRTM